MYPACASSKAMIEPPEVFVFGPYMEEHRREAGDHDALVRVRAVRPGLAQRLAVVRRSTSIGNMNFIVWKPVPPDDAVDLVVAAVGADQAGLVDPA